MDGSGLAGFTSMMAAQGLSKARDRKEWTIQLRSDRISYLRHIAVLIEPSLMTEGSRAFLLLLHFTRLPLRSDGSAHL
ncbi:hypothetical protein M407DRAFT_93569 [Tulasnella calospora MUT 4182]|uniref:Uncharacterized protein n=1 Tax=Tulasnella calospora MUT 4182 TaxID=1051891 RepID=A0A0C3QHJ0_9AGAM|nr:hypothetical protein M407DRAFT_93569 [Tulasnella calospora MUT 4182]